MKLKECGFTLIEVILTIIIAGILGSMIAGYMGTALIRSGESINNINNSLAFPKVMENIIKDYNNSTAIDVIRIKVGSNDHNDAIPYEELCNNAGNICDNTYGTYVYMEDAFIEFDGSGDEIPDPDLSTDPLGNCENLKVTISDSSGHQLTSLFSGSVTCP